MNGLLVAGIITIIMIIVFSYFVLTQPQRPSVVNLVPSDINYVVDSSLYTPIMVNNITTMPKSLQDAGYLKVSVSLFNLTNASDKTLYPGVITSAIYYMKNSSDAETAFQSMIYSNNQNQSVTGYTYKGQNIAEYTFAGKPVKLYTISSVALFNVSPSLLNLTEPYYMPDYQYTTLFAYRNFTGTVIVNSYVGSGKYMNDSLRLGELLIDKIYSSMQ